MDIEEDNMICYKDITFCRNDCQNNKCKIRLTNQVMKDAAKWWRKKNAPIATADLRPECNDYISPKDSTKEQS